MLKFLIYVQSPSPSSWVKIHLSLKTPPPIKIWFLRCFRILDGLFYGTLYGFSSTFFVDPLAKFTFSTINSSKSKSLCNRLSLDYLKYELLLWAFVYLVLKLQNNMRSFSSVVFPWVDHVMVLQCCNSYKYTRKQFSRFQNSASLYRTGTLRYYYPYFQKNTTTNWYEYSTNRFCKILRIGISNFIKRT